MPGRALGKRYKMTQQLRVWEATVRVSSGNGPQIIATRVMAADSYKARLLFEAQYGRGSIVVPPRQIN